MAVVERVRVVLIQVEDADLPFSLNTLLKRMELLSSTFDIVCSRHASMLKALSFERRYCSVATDLRLPG